MCTDLELAPIKEKYPDAAIVAYVNTSAAVKALADVCCTSANAVKVVGRMPQKHIIFVPARNLGAYVQRFHPEKEILLWPGFCRRTTTSALRSSRKIRGNIPGQADVHPECTPEVIDIADTSPPRKGC
jgi:quinolinate synthase